MPLVRPTIPREPYKPKGLKNLSRVALMEIVNG